jgi:Inverse autotransporter, beta-domain
MHKTIFHTLLSLVISFSLFPNSVKAIDATFKPGNGCCPTIGIDTCWSQFCVPQMRPTRFYIGGLVGEGMGRDTRRATAGLFSVFCNPVHLWAPFIDLRGHYLSNNHWASNGGLGLRWVDCPGERIWGAHVFYDFRKSGEGDFNQIGTGMESLGVNFDFRLNGYMPLGRRKFVETGFDAEIGKQLFCCWDFVSIYAAAGTYYYRSERASHFWGGMFRLNVRATQYLNIDFKITYDHRFKTMAQGAFTLVLPFDIFECDVDPIVDIAHYLLWVPVERHPVIVLDQRR